MVQAGTLLNILATLDSYYYHWTQACHYWTRPATGGLVAPGLALGPAKKGIDPNDRSGVVRCCTWFFSEALWFVIGMCWPVDASI